MPLRSIAIATILAALLLTHPARAAAPLPSFHVDLGQTTVSGLSSGAFMALQFHVAFSATVQGAGIIAGGPFYCAQGQLALALNRCMRTNLGTPDPAALLVVARTVAGQGHLDPLANLKDDRAYLFTGRADATVAAAVVEATRQFYLLAGLPAENLAYVSDLPAGHALLTEDEGNACASSDPPFLNDCDYDQAGAILQQLYPDLGPAAARPNGRLIAFDQSEFFRAGEATAGVGGSWPWGAWRSLMSGVDRPLGLNDVGYVYVPSACAEGSTTCKVHVVFHGCEQTVADVEDRFVRRSGYNRWADTNGLLVLYPQARRAPPANPKGCWDWWGYSGAAYATKTGPQMAAVRAMLDRLAGR